MKLIVLHGKQSSLEKQLQEIFTKHGFQVETMQYGSLPGFRLYQQIVDANPDFIVTIDLTGFEMLTDTDDIAFINLTFPSLNFITNDIDMKLLACLSNKLSIAMFFYCEGQAVYDYLMGKCSEIPYLKLVGSWEEAVADALRELEIAGRARNDDSSPQ